MRMDKRSEYYILLGGVAIVADSDINQWMQLPCNCISRERGESGTRERAKKESRSDTWDVHRSVQGVPKAAAVPTSNADVLL